MNKKLSEIPKDVLLGFYAAELRIPEFTLKDDENEYACISQDIANQIADVLEDLSER